MIDASMLEAFQEDTTPEDDSKDLLCAFNKYEESYNPHKDVLLGDFVLVHPVGTIIYHVWMGQTLTIVQLDRNHFWNGKFQISLLET